MSSQSTSPSSSGGKNDAPALTPELFLHHMTAMKTHYQSGASAPYDLPNYLLHSVVPGGGAAALKVAPPSARTQMDAILKKSETGTQALTKRQTDFVNAQSSKLESNKDTSAFAKAMEAQKAQAKADANKQIDDSYNQLIQLGTAHPDLQQHILSAAQRIGAFFTSLIAKVGAFFLDIYHKIVGWIEHAVDWIKNTAADAANWLSQHAGEIVSFFASIF
jgi:hypothetical protein